MLANEEENKLLASANGEHELDSRTIKIQQKRFYIDVKQNSRGRFIKIAEVLSHDRKNRLLFSMSAAHEFKDYLTEFNDLYVGLGPQNPEHSPHDGNFKSVSILRDNRRYFFDLKENGRGRYLRVSQTINFTGGPRYQIRIPAQGMIEFRDSLIELLDEYSKDEDQVSIGDSLHSSSQKNKELPQGTNFRTENKKFYFDIGQNNFGVFMRISEVKSAYRTSITIPENAWPRFRDILNHYCEKSEFEKEKNINKIIDSTSITTNTSTDKINSELI